MDEVELRRGQRRGKEVVLDELDVGQRILGAESGGRLQHPPVHVGGDDPPRPADPAGQQAEPTHGAAADLEGAPTGPVAQAGEETLTSRLPDATLQAEALQLGQLSRHHVAHGAPPAHVPALIPEGRL